jgi:dihydrofolate reductase
MRKIVLGFAMSLDGYIARPDGAVDFLVKDKDASRLKAEFFATV